MKLLLIDNYDSFTYNLFQLFGELGVEQTVLRNDEFSSGDITGMGVDAIVISPGPGRPEDAGVSRSVIMNWGGRMPILGVCLGLQCIVDVYGGEVGRTQTGVMHGKTSLIYHDGSGLFEGVPGTCRVARYHSLAARRVPDCLEVTARTEDGVVMAVAHRSDPVWGVQFHPESFMSEYGVRMMENFINEAEKYAESVCSRQA